MITVTTGEITPTDPDELSRALNKLHAEYNFMVSKKDEEIERLKSAIHILINSMELTDDYDAMDHATRLAKYLIR